MTPNDIELTEMPEPTGYRVLIKPAIGEDTTAGGIILANSVTNANKHLTYVGEVLAMGDLCYTGERFAIGDRDPKPWCSVGDMVLFGQYAGQKIKVAAKDGSDVELVLLNDDEIKSRCSNPANYRAYI